MAASENLHGAHRAPVGAGLSDEPWPEPMDPESREAHELLEALDDAMFEAISGDESALERARDLWQRAVAALVGEQVEESREQYLRYAVETSQECDAGEVRAPSKMLAAAEVISWLTRGAA